MRRNQLEAITSALSDGVISKGERKKIGFAPATNISEQDALAIMSYLSREAKATQGAAKTAEPETKIMMALGR